MIRIVDGHNDALLEAWARKSDLREPGGAPQLDLPRAAAGGIAAGFFAVFVTRQDDGRVDLEREGEPLDPERAARVAGEMTEILLRLESVGALTVARRVADVERAVAGGPVVGGPVAGGPLAAILHLEGAEPLDPALSRLEPLVERGLRSLGLAWSRPNAFATGVPWIPGAPDTGPGLTAAGRELVRACNELGVLVDLSHLNAAGFADVAALSTAPLVATHAAARVLRPGPRSLADEQLRTIAASGGVVGIPLVAELLVAQDELEHATLRDFAAHVEHVAAVAGVDHVAIGSDLDGGALLAEVGDAAGMQRALEALGWSEPELRKLAHENWLRVLRASWKE